MPFKTIDICINERYTSKRYTKGRCIVCFAQTVEVYAQMARTFAQTAAQQSLPANRRSGWTARRCKTDHAKRPLLPSPANRRFGWIVRRRKTERAKRPRRPPPGCTVPIAAQRVLQITSFAFPAGSACRQLHLHRLHLRRLRRLHLLHLRRLNESSPPARSRRVR